MSESKFKRYVVLSDTEEQFDSINEAEDHARKKVLGGQDSAIYALTCLATMEVKLSHKGNPFDE